MPSSIAKDAIQLRLDMRSASRTILSLYEQLNYIYMLYVSGGIKYDGTVANIPADPEAAALVAALYSIFQTLDVSATKQAIVKGSDLGNNLSSS